MTRLLLFALLAVSAAVAVAAQAEGPAIATMDELKFTAPKEKGKADLVEGKVGKAVRFTFDKDARGAFFTSNIRGTPDWDKAAGFSFWVKGDGNDHFAGLQFIHDNDYAVRYDLCFPVKGKDWSKVTVAWSDLVPVLPGPKAKPLAADGNLPSKMSGLWFGKWWYWGGYPAHTFTIDEIRLEPKIERDTKLHKPAEGSEGTQRWPCGCGRRIWCRREGLAGETVHLRSRSPQARRTRSRGRDGAEGHRPRAVTHTSEFSRPFPGHGLKPGCFGSRF